jgi:hypothetical protein
VRPPGSKRIDVRRRLRGGGIVGCEHTGKPNRTEARAGFP